MNLPPLEILLHEIDNKYTLAILGAKRAREIEEGSESLVDSESTKPVTIALNEIAEKRITFTKIKSGIK
ncbi:rna polymerase subunit omega/k/rpb6 [Lucifera butyrica]|uniref:DNA-directed RNA polymerase subunit omega n=1 Tax=Lucifera butyrica TaxID=1351585 RepID=A0A498RB75_9FIRM|nr:DNA-directed RNA polymerase subunit omega [Lucifera butyrica]VBB08137.1 rna polymerase subunit omega/k/rpb6 [Lucifera butyrica]